MSKHILLTCSVLALLTSVAHAEYMVSTGGDGGGDSDDKKLTISWSPIHLVLPVLELQAEYIVTPKIGVAVIGGVGRVSDSTDTITATATEIGAQGNFYLMRPNQGLHVGLEGIYLNLGDIEQDMSVSAAGLAIGPYVGYKLVTGIGFTFVAQLGGAYLAYRAESSTQAEEQSKFIVLLNLNLGWSF